MIDHFSLATALIAGVKKVVNPSVPVSPLERAALYGVGILLLGLITWVTVTTNNNATAVSNMQISLSQIQTTQTLLQTQITKMQTDISEQDKRARNLEYKVFGR